MNHLNAITLSQRTRITTPAVLSALISAAEKRYDATLIDSRKQGDEFRLVLFKEGHEYIGRPYAVVYVRDAGGKPIYSKAVHNLTWAGTLAA